MMGRAHKGSSAAHCPREKQILHKTWQAENPDFLLCRTRQTSACHVAPLPACPRDVALRLALCPSLSLVSPFTCAHLPILHSHGNKRILMGYWWEHEEFDGDFLRTWWEQKDIDGLLMGTWRIWWGFFENLMRTKGYWWVIEGNKKNPMGTFWESDGNKRILMGCCREQEEFDWNHFGTWWE
jgi:hypothetical protein